MSGFDTENRSWIAQFRKTCEV